MIHIQDFCWTFFATDFFLVHKIMGPKLKGLLCGGSPASLSLLPYYCITPSREILRFCLSLSLFLSMFTTNSNYNRVSKAFFWKQTSRLFFGLEREIFIALLKIHFRVGQNSLECPRSFYVSLQLGLFSVPRTRIAWLL